MMDQPTLVRAMGNVHISDEEVSAFNAAMRQADCTNVNRAAMWCAQLGHESSGLKYYEEIASGAAYEGRADLGNTQPGDGRRFKGRGPIQVTGRHNYTRMSRWAHEHGYVDRPDAFVANPELLATVRFGFLGAVWYWTTQRPINDLSDRRDLEGATRAINGGLNGLPDRRARYERCLALGEALLPEGDEMSLADDELGKRFPSRSKYRANDALVDTLAGFVLNIDARIHEEHVERAAGNGEQWAVDLVKREADKGDKGAQAVLDRLKGDSA